MMGVHRNIHVGVMVNHKMVDDDLRLLSASDLPPIVLSGRCSRTTSPVPAFPILAHYIESKIKLW